MMFLRDAARRGVSVPARFARTKPRRWPMTQRTEHLVLSRITKRTHAVAFSAGPLLRMSPRPNEPTENPETRRKLYKINELRIEFSVVRREVFTERTHAGPFSAEPRIRGSSYRTNPPRGLTRSPSGRDRRRGEGLVDGCWTSPLRSSVVKPSAAATAAHRSMERVW